MSRLQETVIMPRRQRCAIYTRKSSEEGLDMEFNSLDAQREACEAYVASQKPEGWVLVPDHYDDGGFSGGTLERPALKRLLADIEAGRVWVNNYHAYPAHAAFGGYKQSGIGRETHKMMLDHYQQTKNMLVSYNPNKLGFF